MTYNLYEYSPSLGAAIVFAVAFSLVGIAHAYLLIRNRTWHFIPFVLGLICESSGSHQRRA